LTAVELIFLVEESLDGGYEAHALGESIYVEAESIEVLKSEIKDAVICHFEPKNIPHVIRIHLVKDEVIAI
jgi:hypothetical protein